MRVEDKPVTFVLGMPGPYSQAPPLTAKGGVKSVDPSLTSALHIQTTSAVAGSYPPPADQTHVKLINTATAGGKRMASLLLSPDRGGVEGGGVLMALPVEQQPPPGAAPGPPK